MPASETTLAGAAVDALRADAGVVALVPAASIYADVLPSEVRLPYVVVADAERRPAWVTTSSALVPHVLTADCYAEEVATPGAKNPADALADAVEAALNWDDLAFAAGLFAVSVTESLRRRSLLRRRSPADLRVYRVSLRFDARLAVG